MHLALVSQGIWELMEYLARHYSYAGVFLISLIGACSIIIPIPYLLIVCVLGHFLDPILLAIGSGLGSAVGELTGYALGYYGRHLISEERKRKMDFIRKLFERYGPIVVFAFALTPLPDDLLFIPLGIIRYNFLKVFLPCILGKVLMSYILAMSGRLSIRFIRDLFGAGGWLEALASTVLLIAIVVIMMRVDWEKVFSQYIERREKKAGKSVT